jgi:hypothetical protein
MPRTERCQVLLRQFEQPHRRSQTPAMFRMSRMFEVLLKMNKRTGRLDQSFEKIIILGVGIEPKMFQNIVRLVIKPVIPASEISAIKRVLGYVPRKVAVVTLEVLDKLRNSFAFGHEALTFNMPQMMGKCEAGRGGSPNHPGNVAVAPARATEVNRPYLR